MGIRRVDARRGDEWPRERKVEREVERGYKDREIHEDHESHEDWRQDRWSTCGSEDDRERQRENPRTVGEVTRARRDSRQYVGLSLGIEPQD